MRQHLFECTQAGNLIVGHSDVHYLIFVTIIASELEHLWKTTCYFAHDECLNNPQLITVYLHREFFKSSLEMNVRQNLDFHTGLKQNFIYVVLNLVLFYIFINRFFIYRYFKLLTHRLNVCVATSTSAPTSSSTNCSAISKAESAMQIGALATLGSSYRSPRKLEGGSPNLQAAFAYHSQPQAVQIASQEIWDGYYFNFLEAIGSIHNMKLKHFEDTLSGLVSTDMSCPSSVGTPNSKA